MNWIWRFVTNLDSPIGLPKLIWHIAERDHKRTSEQHERTSEQHDPYCIYKEERRLTNSMQWLFQLQIYTSQFKSPKIEF